MGELEKKGYFRGPAFFLGKDFLKENTRKQMVWFRVLI